MLCVPIWQEPRNDRACPPFTVWRRPDPWQYPDWSRSNPDGTFGNRFDDPDGEYRVLYASSARVGCFLETLARYRPDMALYAELAEIEGEDAFVPAGVVPREWFEVRTMGSAEAHGRFADVGSSDWILTLRRRLASLLISLGIPDFDASVLQRSGPRQLTQHVCGSSTGRDSTAFATCPSSVTTSKIGPSSSLPTSLPDTIAKSARTTRTCSKRCGCSTWQLAKSVSLPAPCN
jgi:hypothetical protein